MIDALQPRQLEHQMVSQNPKVRNCCIVRKLFDEELYLIDFNPIEPSQSNK